MSNANRIFEQYFVGGYGQKGDKLRINDQDIFSSGVKIAEIASLEDEYEYYNDFLLITTGRYKSRPQWQTHKKQLAKSANKAGLPVVFIPEFDIGFGLKKDYNVVPYAEMLDNLIKVAKFSQDEEVKTACVAMSNNKIIAYSYNQYIDCEWKHAETILTDYIKLLPEIPEDITYLSMLEPCADCLDAMIHTNARTIIYGYPHKEKWNTMDYIELTNDLCRGVYRTNNKHIIKYEGWHCEKIDRFYKPKELK